MIDAINQLSNVLPELIVAFFIFFSLVNQINSQRVKREELRLREREELLEKIDALEKKILDKQSEQNKLLEELNFARPLAAKVPILELQIEQLKLERQQLIERIMILERKFEDYKKSDFTDIQVDNGL